MMRNIFLTMEKMGRFWANQSQVKMKMIFRKIRMNSIVIDFYFFYRINWKIDSIGSVKINNNHERANIDVNGNLPSKLLINGFFGMKFFYGSSALRASDPPKNFIPQKPFISNLEGKFPFTSKGSLMINIFIYVYLYPQIHLQYSLYYKW